MLKKYSHIIYLTLGILIINLFPSFFLLPGTYFLLDTAFAPFTEFKGFFETTFYWHITHILSYVFGYALFSKIFFLGVILTGIGTGVLISRYIGRLFPNYKGKTLDILAIIAAVYNPFIYERMISQTGIALGSYLLIISIILLSSSVASFPLAKGKEFKDGIRGEFKIGILTSLSLGTAWMIYPHAILLIMLMLGVCSLIFYKNILKYILIFFGIILLNLNWLIGDYVLQTNTTSAKIESFDRSNIEVFQGNSLSGLGVDITHLLGYGFWGERYHIVSPDDIIPFWYVFAFLVLGIVLYGGYTLYKRDKKILCVLTIIAISAYILSMGIASALWSGLSEILYTNISFYIGMREPQKWLALTQGVYMLLFMIGSIKILSLVTMKYHIKKIFTIVLIVLPILWTPTLLIGFWGQLNISDYPEDIFTAREFMQTQITHNNKILNLPWHSYMACEWTYAKVTANRAKDIYYPANIVSSDNIEIAHLYTNSRSGESQDIDQYIKNKDVRLLQKNNISHILFSTTCGDKQNYTFLEEDPNIYEKVFDSQHIDIFKINYEE